MGCIPFTADDLRLTGLDCAGLDTLKKIYPAVLSLLIGTCEVNDIVNQMIGKILNTIAGNKG